MSRRTPLRMPRTYDTSHEIPSALRATAVPQESHESHWNNEMWEGGSWRTLRRYDMTARAMSKAEGNVDRKAPERFKPEG